MKFKDLKFRDLRLFLVFVFSLFTFYYSLSAVSHAVHPLITDDTGTQGKGKFQLEVNSEFTYGITDNLDIVLGLPYQWNKVKKDGTVEWDVDGIADVSLEAKWRFFEEEGLSLALKPGITLPTGDEEKGLGTQSNL